MTPPQDETDGSRRSAAGIGRSAAEREAAGYVGSRGSAAAENPDLHRLLVESVRDYAIFVLDPEGHVLSWNAGAERLKGYRPEEIIGRHFSTFYPAEDLTAGKPARKLEIAAREGRVEDEGWRIRKDGSRFWGNVVITALHGEDGQLIGFAKVTRDLTERRAAHERALVNARRLAAAEASNRARSEFLAAMSHELRTPINATLGYAELIGMGISGPVSEQQREYLERIRDSQEHLLRIISDLLNYSRIESGQVQYELAQVPLRRIVDAVMPMVEPQAASKRIELDVSPCADDLVARTDLSKAEQIVLNLLSNAVKFTPAGGRITVRCTQDVGKVLVSVTDTGPGIPEDRHNEIFEPFVQLGRSLTSGHQGTGLGLSISRDLARALGGDVVLESMPGGGATFTVVFPA